MSLIGRSLHWPGRAIRYYGILREDNFCSRPVAVYQCLRLAWIMFR